MEFIKKNYEKVLLGLVLLGLVVAVAFLPFLINQERTNLTGIINLGGGPVPALTNLDMGQWDAAFARASGHLDVDFSEPHRLFNPMEWQMDASGHLVRATQVGPSVLLITNISPYFLDVTLDRVVPISDSPPTYGYYISSATPPAPRRQVFYRVGDPKTAKTLLTIMQVNGPADDPTNMVVRLADTDEVAVLAKPDVESAAPNAPKLTYRRIEGYAASFLYPPERKSFANRRVNTALSFNGDDFTIVNITTNGVMLRQSSNNKNWTIKKQ